MKKITRITLAVALLFGTMLVSCNKSGKQNQGGSRDTLSYVVGMNVGYALLQMDSTLNVESVCEAIRDVYNGSPKMTIEEGREYYLAEKTYFVHERAIAYQEQFLLDLSKRDRQYKRITTKKKNSPTTSFSVAYNMLQLGNQERISRSLKNRDTITMVYTIRNEKGTEFVKADTVRDDYRNISQGLQEVIKIGRDGAKFNAWIASEGAYGTAGDKELGIGPNELLNYDVEVLDIKYNEPKSSKK